MKKAIIVGSSSLGKIDELKEAVTRADYVVSADGGLKYLEQAGIVPDIILGDFDSYDISNIRSEYLNKVKRFSTKKDFTDLELAIEASVDAGYDNIDIYAALYGRLDHTYANIQLIYKYMKVGVSIRLMAMEILY